MTKQKNILILGGLLALTMLASCSKSFLDLEPHASVNSDDAIQTTGDVENAINGMYSDLRQVDLYGRTIPVNGDLLGDNIYVSTVNTGRYIPQALYAITPNDATVESEWQEAYATILACNNIIDAVDKVTALKGDATAKSFQAEAYSVRALMYFELVRNFATPYSIDPAKDGVPLVLHYDRDAKPARSTVAQVYTQIKADLDAAYALYADYRGSAYFSKYASRALQAKVALYTKDYANALTYAKDVIGNSGFTLVKLEAFNAYWESPVPHTAKEKVETLFEVSSDEVNNNQFDELANMFLQDQYGDLLCGDELYDAYNDSDVRKSLIIHDTRDGEAILAVNKYSQEGGDRDDKKVLRLSDIYLIAAEAAHQTSNDGDAVTYLNTLMAQRDPTLQYAAGPSLLDDILTERRKELAFEGDRVHDLHRYNLPIHSLTTDIVIPAGDPRRLLPIPQSELDANPNVNPNPL